MPPAACTNPPAIVHGGRVLLEARRFRARIVRRHRKRRLEARVDHEHIGANGPRGDIRARLAAEHHLRDQVRDF